MAELTEAVLALDDSLGRIATALYTISCVMALYVGSRLFR